MRVWYLFLMFFFVSVAFAQETNSLYQNKKFATSDTLIQLEKVSINNTFFEVLDLEGNPIPKENYQINFEKGILKIDQIPTDSIQVKYLNYPNFLTKTYSIYNRERMVSNEAGSSLFVVPEKKKSTYVPFDGLNTDGSITRGITVGNNQNMVTNSNLDLQITGKLSDKVNIRASIQDSNVPLQNGGYSQKIDEFDQIFIELFSKNWSIKAGDLFIENRKSKYLNFNKKVQGISTKFTFEKEKSKTEIEAAVAIARGQYARSNFIGQEGNQGPYKLKGTNGELYILIISGSEKVYVNGRLLTRGENNDYVIDYNSGEIRFTSLFPITADMRIAIEYQYTDRNYTRYLGYGGINHQTKNWNFAGYVYTESDIKNQPLQQNLSQEQIEILQEAGNDVNKMMAPSAYEDTYSENKILYKKEDYNGTEIFVYSNNPDDQLYSVSFTYMGTNLGNYELVSTTGIGKIYKYVEPIGDLPQGTYEPVSRLIAPTRLMVATVMAKYNPDEKTLVNTEFAFSNNDQNLFSPLDDQNNKGWAGNINVRQRLLSKKINLDAFADFQFIHKNFRPIERLYSIEFDRDWNLDTRIGNQNTITAGLTATLNPQSFITYQMDRLEFTESYKGFKNTLNINYIKNGFTAQSISSILSANSLTNHTNFIRSSSKIQYNKNNKWIGVKFDLEDYQIKDKMLQTFQSASQRFYQTDVFVGRGDSAKMYIELGYQFRANDSLHDNRLQRTTQANAFYVKSQVFKTKTSDLNVYVNYRILDFKYGNLPSENTLNSRVAYNDRFFKNLIQTATIYENTSGSIAQQEFTYIEVEAGLGTHMWNDYNGNGIQELEEFEVALYPDQAKYVRLYLPNQIYLRTHQTKFSEALNINFSIWQNESGFKKWISKFHNQTTYLIDKNVLRNGQEIQWNPFAKTNESLVSINENFRNNFYFNRSKQRYSTTYSYIQNRTKNLLNSGSVEGKLKTHQFQFIHLMRKFWLFNFITKAEKANSVSQNYSEKNYQIDSYTIHPKITYLFSAQASVDLFYEYKDKLNNLGNLETLQQQRLGTSFTYNTSEKFSMNGELSYYENNFIGNQFSAVAFYMLEGLQPGKNVTWRVLFQRNLTKYLDLNLNYQGRTSELGNTIHTGTIQLRAFF
nr:hypothetical protein [uncultured Flavobacterium sp.]